MNIDLTKYLKIPQGRLNNVYWTSFIFFAILSLSKTNKKQTPKLLQTPNLTQQQQPSVRLRNLTEKRATLWSSIMHTEKKTNVHIKYTLSFLLMKSFAILVYPPVSTVTNNPEIWMQITYLKGPNSHFQYNASFWSIVRVQVYTPPLSFASDYIFQMPRADGSPPRTHKSFSNNEAKC